MRISKRNHNLKLRRVTDIQTLTKLSVESDFLFVLDQKNN
jgi:hypothetical protein